MRTPRAAPTRPHRPWPRAAHGRVRTSAIRPTAADAGARYMSVQVLHCQSGRFVRRSCSSFPRDSARDAGGMVECPYLPKMTASAGNKLAKVPVERGQGLRLVQDRRCYPLIGNEVPLQIPLYQFVSQHGPLVVGRANFSARGFQQSVDERYGVLNGIGIDEHAVVRDDPQESATTMGGRTSVPSPFAQASRASLSQVAATTWCLWSSRNAATSTFTSGITGPPHPEGNDCRSRRCRAATTSARRDRQRVHGPAMRCCRTQAEDQPLLDHDG